MKIGDLVTVHHRCLGGFNIGDWEPYLGRIGQIIALGNYHSYPTVPAAHIRFDEPYHEQDHAIWWPVECLAPVEAPPDYWIERAKRELANHTGG